MRRIEVSGTEPGTSLHYVLTGDRTHFVDPDQSYSQCDGHTFALARLADEDGAYGSTSRARTEAASLFR